MNAPIHPARLSIVVLLTALPLFALSGCKPAASTPAGPVASTPLSGQTVNVDAGFDLASVKNQQMIDPQFRLMDPEAPSPLLFAAVRNPALKSTTPVIIRKTLARWKIAELTALPGHEWVHVAACPNRHELWGILDALDDPPAAQLALVRSTDGGLTWQYWQSIKKPAPAAEYGGFALAASGEGRLTLHLDDDADNVAHGYYHYKTADGGKTWTGPTYEVDDLSPADDLKEFDSLPDAIKDTETAATQPQ